MYESLAFGIKLEVISPPKLTASPASSPSVIVPLVPASNVIFPTACKLPPIQTFEDALTTPVTLKVPLTVLSAIAPVKSKSVFPPVFNL